MVESGLPKLCDAGGLGRTGCGELRSLDVGYDMIARRDDYRKLCSLDVGYDMIARRDDYRQVVFTRRRLRHDC